MKNTLVILVAFLTAITLNAQKNIDLEPDFGKFFASGIDDAQKLVEAYIGPYANVFGATMTGGWYNTAKPHKALGFDITATVNFGIVPVADRTFDVSELGLQSLMLADGEDPITSTAPGDNSVGPQINYNVEYGSNQTYTQKAFNMPKGSGVPYFASPMIQLGLGLFKGTEVIGRYMPTMRPGNAELSLWGIGVKHSLKQWIPVIEKVPVLHLSLMGGYTNFDSKFMLSVTPDDIGANNGMAGYDASTWDNQSITGTVKSITGNVIASVNLPIICFYGGLGFTNTKTELALMGDYPTLGFNGAAPTIAVLTDPLNITIENTDGNATKPRMNIGMRLKFGVITLHGDYTRANYNVFTTGIGISFR